MRAGLGFTPACAGRKGPALRIEHPDSVHPRTRGEENAVGNALLQFDGPSPCVRGGATGRSRCARVSRVHLHVRGEEPVFSPAVASEVGSSPRVRGEDLAVHPACVSGRFIPACAAMRGGPRSARSESSIHPPRARGEGYAVAFRSLLSAIHPRVRRGGVSLGIGRFPRVRFIPGCAGRSRS
jgi:hypothetical protein